MAQHTGPRASIPRSDGHGAPLLPLSSAQRGRHRDPLAFGYMSGVELRSWRKQHRWTQKQLATALKYHRNVISSWELGRSAIPFDVYPRLLMYENPLLIADLAVIDRQTGQFLRLFNIGNLA